ncbi:MAG: MFS transporter, partial [Cyanobacteria bacterium J06636_16]
SMTTAIGYGSNIVAPALAGILYPTVGLGGIWPINIATFIVSIAIIVRLTIPQPSTNAQPAQKTDGRIANLWQEVTFGFRYVWKSSSLRTLLIVTTTFLAALQFINTRHDPMILARTDGSSQALGSISTIAGIGGVIGAIALSVWGGFRQNARGMLIGYIGAGFANLVFALGQSLSVWLPTEFFSSLCFPLIWSSEAAVWMKATPAKTQGRVFAVGFLVEDLVEIPIALLAGVLGDRIFEPAIQSSALIQKVFGPVVGIGAGAGIALLYLGGAISMILVGFLTLRSSSFDKLRTTMKG